MKLKNSSKYGKPRGGVSHSSHCLKSHLVYTLINLHHNLKGHELIFLRPHGGSRADSKHNIDILHNNKIVVAKVFAHEQIQQTQSNTHFHLHVE